jgi:c-di-GMP-binding flagellar brake protein YcgR
MREHRRRPRKNTPHHVRVLDDQTSKVMGRVVDITADGMMIICQQQYTVGRHFNLRIVLPRMAQDRTHLVVSCEVVYSNQDPNPSFFKTGFRFLNLPGEDGFLLEDVMHKLNLVG